MTSDEPKNPLGTPPLQQNSSIIHISAKWNTIFQIATDKYKIMTWRTIEDILTKTTNPFAIYEWLQKYNLKINVPAFKFYHR